MYVCLFVCLQLCADSENSLLLKLNPTARTSQVGGRSRWDRGVANCT